MVAWSKRKLRVHIGKRTLKTAVAVIIAMLIVDFFGATSSKLIFAMLGAMAVIQPTFTESLEACLSQIIGVLFGALVGVVLTALPLPSLLMTGIGIVLVITLYNALHIRFSPSLSCFIVVMLCTSPDVNAWSYALGRIWDTAIGLAVGMAINTLIFPYDNSRQIRDTIESLEKEVLHFLEDMFDEDGRLPDAEEMRSKLDAMEQQLSVFSNQRLILHSNRQKEQLDLFLVCEKKARALLARMELLSQMGEPGILSKENRRNLKACGVELVIVQNTCDGENPESIPEEEPEFSELDIVMNYHVRQILLLRKELIEALENK